MDRIPASPPRDNMLSCLIMKDANTQVYISHCLNHDLMECGKTSEEAWENLKTVIKRNLENPSPGLMGRQAKKECWDAFGEAIQRDPSNLKMEIIEIQVSARYPDLGMTTTTASSVITMIARLVSMRIATGPIE